MLVYSRSLTFVISQRIHVCCAEITPVTHEEVFSVLFLYVGMYPTIRFLLVTTNWTLVNSLLIDEKILHPRSFNLLLGLGCRLFLGLLLGLGCGRLLGLLLGLGCGRLLGLLLGLGRGRLLGLLLGLGCRLFVLLKMLDVLNLGVSEVLITLLLLVVLIVLILRGLWLVIFWLRFLVFSTSYFFSNIFRHFWNL